ncbi:MAG: PAS domain S-box protein [Formivibrio sp.]|nr:PAS domain S-box protein [Formivibrio sp.]
MMKRPDRSRSPQASLTDAEWNEMTTDIHPVVMANSLSGDVFHTLLDLTADPQQAWLVMAEEIRRLSSARCIALLRTYPDGAREVTAHPSRHLLEHTELTAFLRQLPEMDGSVLWQASDAPTEVAHILSTAQLANCLVVPLSVEKNRLGALVVLNFCCNSDIAVLTRNVETLARLHALILNHGTSHLDAAQRIEEKYARIAMRALETTRESIHWIDEYGRMIYVNPAMADALGYSPAELRQMRVYEIDPNTPAEFWGPDGELMRVLKTSGLRKFETQHQHRDGYLIPIEVDSDAFEYDGQTYFIAIGHDISQRKTAEKALRDSEAKFSAMFSMTPEPMALSRFHDGVLLEVSESWPAYFGYEREEMIGRSALPDDLSLWGDATYQQHWRELLARDGQVLGFEAPLRSKDGTIMTAMISGKIIDLDGERCIIIDLRDITQRKRMEEELHREKAEQAVLIHKLEEAQNQLVQSEKLAAIGQLAAGVAHEINNPMGFIRSNLFTLKSYADGLLNLVAIYESAEPLLQNHPQVRDRIAQAKREADIGFLTDDMRNLINESLDGADRVRRIVQDMRDFSRVDSAEWTLFDIHAGLESTINVVWNEIKYKAELVRNYGKLQPIECIPSRLIQVFMNLLVNAAQAIVEQGKITISTCCIEDQVEIAFTDTGHGIPADILPKIFDPFFTTKPVGKGTGLGLSVSYSIIKNHGGHINAMSQPGIGTTFTIHLPINRAPEPT